MIYSLDKYSYKHSDDIIFNTIKNFETYKNWWPFFIKFINIEDTKVTVKPIMSPSFSWRIVDIKTNKEIKIKYYSGAYLGIGIWKLSQELDKNTLSYEIKLNINNKFINIASKIINIEKIHKKLMLSVFKKLDLYLKP
jgi:hypothetical protein